MIERLKNSWELVKQSWGVLKQDRELAIFPLMAGIASLLVMATFLIPMVLAGVFDSFVNNGEVGIFSYLVLFLFYIVSYFVTIFSNSALVGAALIRLRGGDPTVKDGLRIAREHIGQIFSYAVIAATVGLVLKMISERSGAIGKIVTGLIGLAWSLATFLVVPVLITEDLGPVDAIKRSGNLLKKTWGEQVAGNFGIGTIMGLVTFGAILLFVPLFIVAVSAESVALIITIVALLLITLIVIALISSALSGIYAAAVYQYAITGKAGEFYDPSLLKDSFKTK
jgi:hypothetical protein